MALTYTGANGLFTLLGKLIKQINLLEGLPDTTLPGYRDDVLDTYFATTGTRQEGARRAVEGLDAAFEQFNSGTLNWRRQLAGFIDKTLQDFDNVVKELNLTTTNVTEVLRALISQMKADAQTINASTVTIGTPTYASANNGNGVLLVTKKLDAVQVPTNLSPFAHVEWKNVDTELVVPSETLELKCTADSQSNSTSEAAEQFSVAGAQMTENLDHKSEGSGDGSTITVLNASGIIQNRNFESFSPTNKPTSWDLGTSVLAGTHVFEDSTAAKVHRGSKALKFTGDGALATISISQAITISSLTPRKRYLFAIWVLADASVAAGDLLIQPEGTGFTAATETVEVQTVQISGTPTGGSYTLTWTSEWGTQTTAAIAHNATSADVQTALRALKGLESVVVSTSAGAPPDVTHQITFRGTVGNINQLTSTSSLTGGTPVITHATTTQGVEGERIFLPAAALPTTYSLRYFWITMPTVIPSDLKMAIKWQNTPTNAKNLWLDSIAHGEVSYRAGVGLVLIAGKNRWMKNDKISQPISNSEGTIQKYFRRRYGVQLPSSGAPTIVDGLAA